MTRKQALNATLAMLNEQPQTQEITEIIHKLNEIIADLPLNHWTEEAIFDAFSQFHIDNGRNATTTDLKFRSSGLPPHTVIKLRFKITSKQFIDKYFPTQPKCVSKIFAHKSKEEWLTIFINEYEKIKPSSGEDYNANREKGLPSWQFVSKLFDITLWREFQTFCGLQSYTKNKTIKAKESTVFNIKSHSDYDEEIKRTKI